MPAGRVDIPPAVFEALVDAWTDLLVADYHAKHAGPIPVQAGEERLTTARVPSSG
jgi:hypothetical protein